MLNRFPWFIGMEHAKLLFQIGYNGWITVLEVDTRRLRPSQALET